MIIQCIICTEIINGSRNISAVPCGHVFHEECLTKWLTNSMTCPQCRNKVTKKASAFKLFFSQSDPLDSSQIVLPTANSELNEKITALKQDLSQKTHEHIILLDEKFRLEDRLDNMTKDLKKEKERYSEEKMKCTLLRNELDYQKALAKDLEISNKLVTDLKGQLETLKNVQFAVNGSETDVNKMLSECTDSKQLSIWCCLFKKELESKKIDLRLALDTNRKLKKDLYATKQQLSSTTSKILRMEDAEVTSQETIAFLEDQVKSLNKKITALQAAINSPRPTTSSLVYRLLHESPYPLNISTDDILKDPPKSFKKRRCDGNYDDENVDVLNGTYHHPNNGSDNNNINDNNVIVDNDSSSKENKVASGLRDYHNKNYNNNNNHVNNNNDDSNNSDDKSNNNNNNTKLKSGMIMNLGIFKKHNSFSNINNTSNTKSSTEPSSLSSSSSSSSSSMVVRKGYNGFGGHDRFVAPLPKINNKTGLSKGVTNIRKHLGPSTSSSSSSSSVILKKIPSLLVFDDDLTL